MLDTKHEDNNGLQNEDLIVWMRTAALPNFRKLYRKINHTDREEFKEGLPKGTYTLNIDYSEFGLFGFAALSLIRFSSFFCRISCDSVLRHQVGGDLDDVAAGREEPLPGHCLHNGGLHLPAHGRRVPLRPHQVRQAVSIRQNTGPAFATKAAPINTEKEFGLMSTYGPCRVPLGVFLAPLLPCRANFRTKTQSWPGVALEMQLSATIFNE